MPDRPERKAADRRSPSRASRGPGHGAGAGGAGRLVVRRCGVARGGVDVRPKHATLRIARCRQSRPIRDRPAGAGPRPVSSRGRGRAPLLPRGASALRCTSRASREDRIDTAIACLERGIARAAHGLVGRRHLVELVHLALVAREHVLLIGPPGTGKSAVVRACAAGTGARCFEYLIGRFTEPAELFGPLDLEALRAGKLRPDIAGMLPEAEFAFLDEVFLGSTAILNALLGVLNERRYRRGHFETAVPLRCCVGASNALPEDPALAAFADRFLVTAFVDPLADSDLEALLAGAAGEPEAGAEPPLTLAGIDALAAAAARIDLTPVRPAYAQVVRKLRARGVPLSDRRVVRGQALVAAAALIAGRTEATAADLWPLIHLVQHRIAQDEARDLLRAELGAAASPVLPEAAKAAGYGPAARAADLAREGEALAAAAPADRAAPAFEAWLVRAESFLVQVDAAFATEARPPALAAARDALLARCREPAGAGP
ncbi:AAA family ATPase [Methylobacterium aquaticum]|uniref:AAA family ATPase n=1 Tax=Methylobacterium aquaticum TaxID=270351 RepID=UPI00247808FB|nr:AAA family ATPase [Methylobacterium aquaticum]